MSNKNFTLTYDELLLLLKDAYRNGYSTYEMTAAGLEPYDDDGYARWVLLGMEKNKQEELDNTDKKLHISDVMERIESLMDEDKQAKINITKCDNSFDYDNLDRRISTLRYLFIEIDVWKYVS